MNILWILMMIISLGFFVFGEPSSVIEVMNTSVSETIDLCISLCAIYILWMGLLQIVEDSGLSNKLALFLAPVIRLLFGNVSKEASQYIAMNLSANILGLGNASTPAGLRAMKALDNGKGVLSMPMAMLFALNCCSLQLLPTTIISLRSQYGSANSSDVIFPIIIVSIICCVICISLVKIFYKKEGYKK